MSDAQDALGRLNRINRNLGRIEGALLGIVHIMSAVTDFTAKVQKNFDQVNADLDSITNDITKLNAQIQALQNSPGVLSASDQTALDNIAAASAALQVKADAVIPPVVPTPPVV